MRRDGVLSILLLGLGIPGVAHGEKVDVIEVQRKITPNISAELLDPTAQTRFHLATRFSFSGIDEDGQQSAFTKDAVTSIEAKAIIQVAEGIGIGFVLPLGLETPNPGDDSFVFGNVRTTVVGGARIWLPGAQIDDPRGARIGVGGALDLYLPTSKEFQPGDCGDNIVCNPNAAVRGIRSYEPELYLERTAAARFRAHVDFSISIITAELELGLSPAVRTKQGSDFLMLFSWAGRLAARPIDQLEAFLEAGSALQVSGDPLNGVDLDTDVLLTLGLRGHFVIDPALFVSFNLNNGGVIFGIDIAAALRPVSRQDRDLRDPLKDL